MSNDQAGTVGVGAEATPTIEPMLSGKFAIYEDGKGGFWLMTETTEHGVQRKHIPAALVKLASSPGLFGRRFGGIFGS